MFKPKGMPEAHFELMFAEIQENQRLLDNCKCHQFPTLPPLEQLPRSVGLKLDCVKCGGRMDAVRAYEYAKGYAAAGGDPNDVFPGWG